MFSYEILRVNSLTPHISQIFLSATLSPIIYQAGQYIEVIHPDGDFSPLSIACAPHEAGLLEFHLFHSHKNNKALDLLQMTKQEKKWKIRGSFGTCTIENVLPDKPIIFIAQGTGFAQIKAIMEGLAKINFSKPIHFYWWVANENEFYLLDLVKSWENLFSQFVFIPLIQSIENFHHVVFQHHRDISAFQVFVTGSQRLVQSAFNTFQDQGLPVDAFHSDLK